MADQSLTQWQQLTQNVGIGPHLPLLAVPPVCTLEWTERNWARWMGVSVEVYRQIQRIEQGRVR